MPVWGSSCFSKNGPCQEDCAGCGCDLIAGVCSDVFRGDLEIELPAKDKEPKRANYFWGRFRDDRFVLDYAGHLGKFGLKKGDVLVSIGSRKVSAALFREMCARPPAAKTRVRAERGGRPFVFTVERKKK
jgi:hypothetical protein